jgi:predicted transcriptional regulator
MIIEGLATQLITEQQKVAVMAARIPEGTDVTLVTEDGSLYECKLKSSVLVVDAIPQDDFLVSDAKRVE